MIAIVDLRSKLFYKWPLSTCQHSCHVNTKAIYMQIFFKVAIFLKNAFSAKVELRWVSFSYLTDLRIRISRIFFSFQSVIWRLLVTDHGCYAFILIHINRCLIYLKFNGSRQYFGFSSVVVTGDFRYNVQSIQLTCFLSALVDNKVKTDICTHTWQYMYVNNVNIFITW